VKLLNRNGAKQPLSLLTGPALQFSDKSCYKGSFKPTAYFNLMKMMGLPVAAFLFCKDIK
jgi:hypothetical protein